MTVYFTFLSFFIGLLPLQFLSFLTGLFYGYRNGALCRSFLDFHPRGLPGLQDAAEGCGSGSALFCSFWLALLIYSWGRYHSGFLSRLGLFILISIIGSQMDESAGGAYYLTLYLFCYTGTLVRLHFFYYLLLYFNNSLFLLWPSVSTCS